MPEQIIRKLKTAKKVIAQSKTFACVCRAREVSELTYHRGKQFQGGIQADQARWLSQLEKELLRVLAEGNC